VWLTLTITILVFIEFAQCTVEELLAYRRQRGQNDFTPSAGAAEVRQRNIDSGATRRDSSPAVDLYSCENCNRVFDNALELVEVRILASRLLIGDLTKNTFRSITAQRIFPSLVARSSQAKAQVVRLTALQASVVQRVPPPPLVSSKLVLPHQKLKRNNSQ
jgi:hypothetical protein